MSVKDSSKQPANSNVVVSRLAPYVTEPRKARIETVIAGRLQGIQLAIEAPADINNALAAVRTAEALGVSRVHIIQAEGEARGARTITQGAIYWVQVCFYSSWSEFLILVQQEGLQLVGGMVTATEPLSAVPIDKPLCLLIGNEQRGLSEQAQKDCVIHYKVPMFGMTESLNLSVSAAISLYDTTTRKRLALGKNSDLNPQQQQDFRAEYYLKSVAPRLAKALLNPAESR